jgi:FtsP/CotA-like multicopper oxidase with cupredoxin domain
MLIVKNDGALEGFNQWTLNGEASSMASMKPVVTVHQGRRYRLKYRNASDDIHPLHLHRHSFDLTRVGGKATSGIMKDAVILDGFQETEFDFVADNPGFDALSLSSAAAHGLWSSS